MTNDHVAFDIDEEAPQGHDMYDDIRALERRIKKLEGVVWQLVRVVNVLEANQAVMPEIDDAPLPASIQALYAKTDAAIAREEHRREVAYNTCKHSLAGKGIPLLREETGEAVTQRPYGLDRWVGEE